LQLELNLGGGSFKSQLKRADKSGARLALILGEEEVAQNVAGLKPLRSDEDQSNVAVNALPAVLRERLNIA
jgi:histidyl-tRNA synthetase